MGQAIALNFARAGCHKLFLVDLFENGLQETKQMIITEEEAAEIELHIADISVPDAVFDMVTKCVSRFGRLDFGINNAGIALGGIKTADISLAMFDKSCAVNEKGVGDHKVMQAFLVLLFRNSLCPVLTLAAIQKLMKWMMNNRTSSAKSTRFNK